MHSQSPAARSHDRCRPEGTLQIEESPVVHELIQELQVHPVYRAVTTVPNLRRFTEHHVFAVWDFMSLLKSLQRQLTCVDVPWLPAASSKACRLINEIVLGEESDTLPDGGHASHFALYLHAMSELGANRAQIDRFVALLRQGTVEIASRACALPPSVSQFLETTFSIINAGRVHEIAAVFALSREDLVPQMFARVAAHASLLREDYPHFFYYLDRHIELDTDSHGPMAHDLLVELCGSNNRLWGKATAAVERALRARVALWDGVLEALST